LFANIAFIGGLSWLCGVLQKQLSACRAIIGVAH
jgi:hypothetical protein